VSEVHIGAQGWNYDDWVGGFYPPGTRAAEYLDLYVRVQQSLSGAFAGVVQSVQAVDRAAGGGAGCVGDAAVVILKPDLRFEIGS
jgi:hypothetical protein